MDGASRFIRYARSVFKGGDFGVVEEVVFVPAFADEFAIAVDNDATDGGVGRCEADAPTSQVEGTAHPVGVLGTSGHVRGFFRNEFNRWL